MKKLGLVMAVLMVATPVWARVDIKCAQDGKVVTVSYAVVGYPTTEPNKVRGFGLDITVDNEAKIIDVSNYPVYPTDYLKKYWVYPGGIVISGGQVTDPNKPVALSTDPGALGGIGTGGITIEMGSLYYPTGDESVNAPPLTGTLLKFEVDKVPCYVTITENATRGGVVATNPNLNPDVNSPGVGTTPKFYLTAGIECLPNTVSYYQDWLLMGKPNCWCYPRQCRGDADGKMEGGKKTGYNYVHFIDLSVLLAGWNVLEPATPPIPSGPGIVTVTAPNGIPCVCADFAHDQEGGKKTGYNRVHFNDLSKLLASWNILEPATPPIPSGPGVPGDCGGSLVPP
jgi:hypothetical protein